MGHRRTLVIGTLALSLASASPAAADPGTGQPTDPNCFGQSVVGFAQTYGGIRNAADAFNVTIQQGHNFVRATCGRTSGYPTP